MRCNVSFYIFVVQFFPLPPSSREAAHWDINLKNYSFTVFQNELALLLLTKCWICMIC